MFLSKLIDRRIAAYQRSLVNIHFEEVENMYEQIRGYKHDLRNHLQTMKAHALEGDIPAVINYLNALDIELQTVDIVQRTGNRMADAILNSKLSLARSRGITVISDAQVSIELTISQLDLCIILGNLLDNAIEATIPLPKEQRIIRVFVEMKANQLYISITNTAAHGKQSKIGRRHATTKGLGHGFGLARIDRIVERYGGYITRNSEEGAYSTEILLPQ